MVGFMTGLIFSKDSHFITVHNLISQAKISHFFFFILMSTERCYHSILIYISLREMFQGSLMNLYIIYME